MLVTIWLIVSSNGGGFFLPKFSTSVTFIGISLSAVLLLGTIASLINSIIFLTTYGVIMGIVFVISLVTMVGAIIFQLLTAKVQVLPFVPIIIMTIGFYFLTMIPLALKDVIRSIDVEDGGEYDRAREGGFSSPLSVP